MKYIKPTITVQVFTLQSFLAEDDLSSAGDNNTPFVDDTNLGDVAHEIINNIFDFTNP